MLANQPVTRSAAAATTVQTTTDTTPATRSDQAALSLQKSPLQIVEKRLEDHHENGALDQSHAVNSPLPPSDGPSASPLIMPAMIPAQTLNFRSVDDESDCHCQDHLDQGPEKPTLYVHFHHFFKFSHFSNF